MIATTKEISERVEPTVLENTKISIDTMKVSGKTTDETVQVNSNSKTNQKNT
jgi:hypothetical protein